MSTKYAPITEADMVAAAQRRYIGWTSKELTHAISSYKSTIADGFLTHKEIADFRAIMTQMQRALSAR